MKPISSIFNSNKRHLNTAEQRSRGETALLSIVIITGLLLIVFGPTACNASSAATEPPTRNSSPPPPLPTTTESSSRFPQFPLDSSEDSISTSPLAQSPTATSTPTSTSVPTPSPTPVPSLRRLTSGGCCVQPFFSPDGKQVLFIDKPTADAPVGIYGVDLTDPQAAPALVNYVIGFRSPDRTIVATMIEDDLVHFTNGKNGQSWTVDTGSNWPYFSPNASQILWVATDREGPYDQRQSDIWLANLDGSNARLLISLYGGGFAGWFPNGEQLLLIGRDNPADEELTLLTYDLETDSRTNLFSHKRLRGIEISPGGSWVAYFLSFSEEPADNGVWVINTDSAERRKLDAPGFGAYRWRDDDTLLYIPMRISSEESMQLWAVDAATGQSWPLTDPASLPFSVANGDWDVSPDGQHVIFVSSADQNIWLITLPR
jgi:Tol biopolymer transport system component